jgi:hypothetical protein
MTVRAMDCPATVVTEKSRLEKHTIDSTELTSKQKPGHLLRYASRACYGGVFHDKLSFPEPSLKEWI